MSINRLLAKLAAVSKMRGVSIAKRRRVENAESVFSRSQVYKEGKPLGVGMNYRLPPPQAKGARGGNLFSFHSTNPFPPLSPRPQAVGDAIGSHVIDKDFLAPDKPTNFSHNANLS